jgi:hypothetical protein
MTLDTALMTETELVARELGELMMRASDLLGLDDYLAAQDRALAVAEKSGGLVDGTLTLRGMKTVRRMLSAVLFAEVIA